MSWSKNSLWCEGFKRYAENFGILFFFGNIKSGIKWAHFLNGKGPVCSSKFGLRKWYNPNCRLGLLSLDIKRKNISSYKILVLYCICAKASFKCPCWCIQRGYVYISVTVFICIYTLCTLALARLHKCIDSSDPWLLVDAISTKISCTGSFWELVGNVKTTYLS